MISHKYGKNLTPASADVKRGAVFAAFSLRKIRDAFYGQLQAFVMCFYIINQIVRFIVATNTTDKNKPKNMSPYPDKYNHLCCFFKVEVPKEK